MRRIYPDSVPWDEIYHRNVTKNKKECMNIIKAICVTITGSLGLVILTIVLFGGDPDKQPMPYLIMTMLCIGVAEMSFQKYIGGRHGK